MTIVPSKIPTWVATSSGKVLGEQLRALELRWLGLFRVETR
ncbi:hypothetical protein AtEden1_Chr1g0050631 [Arabidopsis thaliana]